MNSNRKTTWFEKQKLRKKNPFFRLLNRSFVFRLLIASAISFGILAAVHRYEKCHTKGFTTDCLLNNFGAIFSIGNVESFSIVTAAWLYILDGSKRKQQSNQEALELITASQASGVVYSLARIQALETASETGIYFDHLNLQGANLEQIEIPYTRMRQANLSNTVLLEADLSYTDLQGADLSQADLTRAKLTGANLKGAKLTGANLKGANLGGANLTETNLKDVNLTETNLSNVDLSLAHLENTILPPNT